MLSARMARARIVDPYGIYNDLQLEEQCIGRAYFARSPESEFWVWFGDLPDKTREALWNAIAEQSSRFEEDIF